jgi:hypothetical protein
VVTQCGCASVLLLDSAGKDPYWLSTLRLFTGSMDPWCSDVAVNSCRTRTKLWMPCGIPSCSSCGTEKADGGRTVQLAVPNRYEHLLECSAQREAEPCERQRGSAQGSQGPAQGRRAESGEPEDPGGVSTRRDSPSHPAESTAGSGESRGVPGRGRTCPIRWGPWGHTQLVERGSGRDWYRWPDLPFLCS